MTCPKCGNPMYCECDACHPRNPPGVKTYRAIVWTAPDGTQIEVWVCGYCGFEASCDWWLDWEMQGLYFIEALEAVGIDII